MHVVLKRPEQPDSVIITIDQAQQVEQLRAWLAPDVTLTLPEELPDHPTLSAADFKEMEAAFAKAVKQLPVGTAVTQSSTLVTQRSDFFEFSSPEHFRIFCSNNGIFKSVWAPHLDEQ